MGRKRVVIVGGGTAGWMTASALVKLLGHACTVDLVESEEIGIVGVGEATLPHLRAFIATLGLEEAAFMRTTHATFKLGIEFRDFGRIGDAYLHPFGEFGRAIEHIPFHHFWLKMRSRGLDAPISDYSLCNVMAAERRFARPVDDRRSLLSSVSYAYQFDATLFAPLLRTFAIALGARRSEGRVVSVERDGESGDVTAVALEDGRRLEGDLFIDCSGFRSLLMGEALGEPWEDWAHWLPCDRAVAVPCASPSEAIEPFTRATAMPAGWRWRIPLTQRVGNGYVYSSSHLDDARATDALVAGLDGKPLADPRVLRFRAGRRQRGWVHNVIAIGLASGFLEPLESTSIYLAQAAIMKMIELFPARCIAPGDRREFNCSVDYEYDRVRDFLVLHYHATTRDDSAFWNDMRTMTVPDSLVDKMELFRRAGRIERYSHGLFLEPSWLAVYLGQGILPQRWDQRAEAFNPDELARSMNGLRDDIRKAVLRMPYHGEMLLQ